MTEYTVRRRHIYGSSRPHWTVDLDTYYRITDGGVWACHSETMDFFYSEEEAREYCDSLNRRAV